MPEGVAKQAWDKASIERTNPPHVEREIRKATSKIEAEYFRTCIKLQKFVQNCTEEDLELAIQKAMCTEWNAPKENQKRLEYIFRAVVKHT